MNKFNPIFELGQIVVTAGAQRLLNEVGRHPSELIARHVSGSFGDLSDDDLDANAMAVVLGGQIRSRYSVGRSPNEANWKIVVVTMADRRTTEISLQEER